MVKMLRANLPHRLIQRPSPECSRRRLRRSTTLRTLSGTRFASILISEGESLAYVKRMLGHASIKLTAELYGSWLPMTGRGADRLDEGRSGSKVVTTTVDGIPTPAFGGTSGNRPPKSFVDSEHGPADPSEPGSTSD
jgi:hypothetical protein